MSIATFFPNFANICHSSLNFECFVNEESLQRTVIFKCISSNNTGFLWYMYFHLLIFVDNGRSKF